MNSSKISLYLTGLKYACKNAVSGMEYPFIGGIVLTDRCNLHCKHCFVSGRNIPDLTFQEVIKGLTSLYGMGMKNLYIEGGEPFLWRDGEKTLHDVINLARGIGFKYVALYTNGTFPIEIKTDTVFVSLDGMKEVHDLIRGKSYERILFNIRQSSHKKILINYTVTKKNLDVIEEFLEEMRQIKNIKGTFFYLYTPSKGVDELYLTRDEKKGIIGKILYLKSRGYNIVNSKSGLLSVYNDTWKRPTNLNYIFAENRMFTCCRDFGNAEICKDCGYLGFAEIYKISSFNLNAIFTAMKYY